MRARESSASLCRTCAHESRTLHPPEAAGSRTKQERARTAVAQALSPRERWYECDAKIIVDRQMGAPRSARVRQPKAVASHSAMSASLGADAKVAADNPLKPENPSGVLPMVGVPENHQPAATGIKAAPLSTACPPRLQPTAHRVLEAEFTR